MWDDPGVDWERFALVVVRSAWDYAERVAEFLRWAEGLPAVENPSRCFGSASTRSAT